jgi:hypothetical protein
MRDDLHLAPDRGMGTALLAGMAGVALAAALIVWAPSNGSRVANNPPARQLACQRANPPPPLLHLLLRPRYSIALEISHVRPARMSTSR